MTSQRHKASQVTSQRHKSSPTLPPSPLPSPPCIPYSRLPPHPHPHPRGGCVCARGGAGRPAPSSPRCFGADEEPLPLGTMLPAFRDVWADWCLHQGRPLPGQPRRALRGRRWRPARPLTRCARHGRAQRHGHHRGHLQRLAGAGLGPACNAHPITHQMDSIEQRIARLLPAMQSLSSPDSPASPPVIVAEAVPVRFPRVPAPPDSLDENGEYCW